jgi:hypothetical protein
MEELRPIVIGYHPIESIYQSRASQRIIAQINQFCLQIDANGSSEHEGIETQPAARVVIGDEYAERIEVWQGL